MSGTAWTLAVAARAVAACDDLLLLVYSMEGSPSISMMVLLARHLHRI